VPHEPHHEHHSWATLHAASEYPTEDASTNWAARKKEGLPGLRVRLAYSHRAAMTKRCILLETPLARANNLNAARWTGIFQRTARDCESSIARAATGVDPARNDSESCWQNCPRPYEFFAKSMMFSEHAHYDSRLAAEALRTKAFNAPRRLP
jgi:hypothetical protein